MPGDFLTVTVKSCQRCGNDHYGLRFTPLNNPANEYAWWALCPTALQPLLLAVIPARRINNHDHQPG